MGITWQELKHAINELTPEELQVALTIVIDTEVITVQDLGIVVHNSIDSECMPRNLKNRKLGRLSVRKTGLFDVEVAPVLVIR